MTSDVSVPPPRGLRSLSLAAHYRSDREDVVADFYIPALSVASSYSRAVGYFTASSLSLFARGLDEMASAGGHMRLIASPHLDPSDIADLERGYELKDVLDRAVLRELPLEGTNSTLDTLSYLGRLIATGVLDVRLAFLQRQNGLGLYHEKLGAIRDGNGDLIAFTGSANETVGGLMINFESIEVFHGWAPGDGLRALRIEEDFDDLWANRTPNLSVVPFPDVARERLMDLARERPNAQLPRRGDGLVAPPEVSEFQTLSIPPSISPRPYQKEAVEAWLRNRGRGMFKMATGTGKTKTALMAASQLYRTLQQREQPLVVVVLAPLQHLVDQWIEEVETFGVRPIAVYESSARWIPMLEEQLTSQRLGQRPVIAMVATNKSFAAELFQNALSRINQPLLLIADEAHNLGSAAYRSGLPAKATYRLALSATPERWLDEEGTAALVDFFGPTVFELGLDDAIHMGALCRYRYVPRLVELTPTENELYATLTAQIAQRFAAGDDVSSDADSALGQLLRRRTAVLGHAERKLEAVRMDIASHSHEHFQLIYCAEGRRPTEPGDPEGPRQTDQVLSMVGNDLRMSAHLYTSDTPRRERPGLMNRFGSGSDLQALVAMRCLDEGVDIPDARTAYLLASSSNPRQFIQRRGRILRPAPGKSMAVIYDYLAVPPHDASVNFDVERRLLIRELVRVEEFAKLAENYGETLTTLRPLKDRYQLMHL